MSKFLKGILVSGLGYHEDTDISYAPTSHYIMEGVVEELGLRDELLEGFYNDGYHVSDTLKVGDTIRVFWWGVDKGEKIGDFTRIEYNHVVGIMKGKELIPINGNVLFESDNRKFGQIVSVATDVEYYLIDGEQVQIELPQKGDYVKVKGAQRVEVGRRQTLDKKLYTCQASNILVSSTYPIS